MKFFTFISPKQINFVDRVLLSFQGFAHFLDGLVLLFSLGFIVPSFVLSLSRKRLQIKIEREQKRKGLKKL